MFAVSSSQLSQSLPLHISFVLFVMVVPFYPFIYSCVVHYCVVSEQHYCFVSVVSMFILLFVPYALRRLSFLKFANDVDLWSHAGWMLCCSSYACACLLQLAIMRITSMAGRVGCLAIAVIGDRRSASCEDSGPCMQ